MCWPGIYFKIRDLILRYSTEVTPKRKAAKKTGRKWGDEAPTEADMESLDYSTEKSDMNDFSSSKDVQSLVDKASMGSRNKEGMYEVKDWEFEINNTVAEALKTTEIKSASASTAAATGSLGTFGSLFSRLTGSKILTDQDLKPVLDAMKQHLMKKNVAMEIADKVCEGVGENLVGKKVGGFQSRLRF